jgi:RND family efflux transporter MFP subunit
MKELLSLAGEISADERIVLRFQTSGRLAWVGVKEGDIVKKYQTIASLDQREVKKKLQKSLLAYSQTRNSFDQVGLDNQRIGDQPTTDWDLGDKMKRLLENSQYGLESSVLDVELTNMAIEYSNLYTPIEGVVTRADSKYAGVNITPSQAEFEIINPKSLYFSFTADQTEITKISEGMKGEINLDSFPDETKSSSLYYVSYTPKAGETGTVYEGRVRIPADELNKYRFGMTGDVSFILSEKNNVVVVQDKFIKAEGDKKFVWRKKNGQQEKAYIKTGLETDGFVEILSGVEMGDVILNVQN